MILQVPRWFCWYGANAILLQFTPYNGRCPDVDQADIQRFTPGVDAELFHFAIPPDTRKTVICLRDVLANYGV